MPLHRIFFSLLLLFLPTQLGYHFWPEWAMVLGRRVDYLAPTIYLTDILIGLTLLSWTIEMVVGRGIRYYGFKSIIHNTKTIIPLLLFVGLNIFFASSQPVAVYKWVKVLEFIGLGFYIIKTKPQVPFIIRHLSFGILYSSLIAIGQFMMQRSVGGPLWWLGERTFSLDTPGIAAIPLRLDLGFWIWDFGLSLRPYATFPHPNVLGGFLAATLPLVINLQIYKSTNLQINAKMFKILKWTIIALGTVALVLTFSRSAIVVGAMGIGWAYYVLGKRKNRSVFSLIPHTIPLILLGMLLLRTIDTNDESIVVRNQLNAAAIKLWQQSPIIGVGLGNFLTELPKALPSRTIYFLQPVHNIYFLVLAETGVVGLGLFLSILWIAIRNKGKVIRKKKDLLMFPCLLSLISYLLLGLVDHYPVTLQQGQLLLTILLSVTMSAW